MRQINLFKVFMSPQAPKLVSDVLVSGFIGQGPKVEEFESRLRDHFGNNYVNTVNSCTSGLQLVLHMLKTNEEWTEDAEVLTTPLTCSATTFAILANNVKLKWVDVDPNTGNVDTSDIARKLSPKTKAIMLVHWGGYACDLDEIKTLQYRCGSIYGHYPTIIEDCAHAWGATYKDKLIGSHGNFSVFSLGPIKHISSGDGGIIISPNDTLHKQAKLLRWYGLDRNSSSDFRCEQNVSQAGYKYHMNDINAAIGLANLHHSDDIVKAHRDNGEYYDRELAGVPGVRLMKWEKNRQSSYWIYTLRVDDRTNFARKMKEKGIAVSQVHDRNDKHACVSQFRSFLPGMDELASDMCCIPCGWWVTQEDREYVVNVIKEGW